ncbi:gamma-glutamyltranspeptidase [Peribacillus cavernae]|nr:gamma-glutamyltranspeptidase [Peribacillus cavernae]
MSAPPPFSGISLIQSLQMAEMLNIHEASEDITDFIHLTGEISQRTYSDRIHNLGDPVFNDISVKKLTEKDYSIKLSDDISFDEQSDKYRLDQTEQDEEHTSTTHFVVTDKEGTVVSATNTLSNFFGSGIYIDGFFLNNNLDNFN